MSDDPRSSHFRRGGPMSGDVRRQRNALQERSTAGGAALPQNTPLAPLTLRSNTGAPPSADRSGLSPSDKVLQRNPLPSDGNHG